MPPSLPRPFPRAAVRATIVVALAATALTSTARTAGAATSGVPFGHLDSVVSTSTGVRVTGWAIDPDTYSPISVSVTADGHALGTLTAGVARSDVAASYGRFGADHGFAPSYVLASGSHSVCVTADNAGSAGADKSLGCLAVTVVTNPAGHVNAIANRSAGGTSITVSGWAADPQTNAAASVLISVDGAKAVSVSANRTVAGLAPPFPGMSSTHGFSQTFAVSTRAHHVHVVAVNVGLGADVDLGTLLALPAGATVSSAPTAVTVHTTSTTAIVSWLPPASRGGASVSSYVVTSSPATRTTTVGAIATRATVGGLSYGVSYRFYVRAVNLVGTSPSSSASSAVTLKAAVIGPVTSPAMISTSRYIRDINGASTDAGKARSMGAADGAANPSNHRYLTLLQIGGQNTSGVVLTATSIYVSYAETVTAMKGYLDGYASTQRANAPAIIAFGTNNDMDVRKTTGAIWADQVVDPLAAYAKRYPNITVAGANDIEPGFRGSVAGSMDWVRGYLAATSAMFVFNGSADGCSWTSAHSACNDGWRADYISWMAGGLAPTRILALPQIYNHTMAQQWRYISITGIENGRARTNFAGPLTEYTACVLQHGGCGSLTNNSAWTALWDEIQADSRVRQSSLPYGTDLRVN